MNYLFPLAPPFNFFHVFSPQSTFCPEKKSADKFGLGSQYVLMNELGEVASTVLGDPKVTAVLNKFSGMVDFFHFSDQYSGPKQPEYVVLMLGGDFRVAEVNRVLAWFCVA